MSVNIPIGTRVRWFREGRELTQLQVAQRAGVSIDYVGMIERGLRTPPTHTLHLLAEALGVSMAALRGQGQGGGSQAIDNVRAAMLGLSPSPQPTSLEEMREGVAHLGDRWFGNDDTESTARFLPELIGSAEYIRGRFTTPQEEASRRDAERLIFQTYYVARNFCSALGAADVALTARERCMRAAEATDHPFIFGLSRWALSFQLMGDGYLDAAEGVVRRQIEEVDKRARDHDDDATHALLGMLYACASIVAVRQGDVSRAQEYVLQAEPMARATDHLPDTDLVWSAWGPTNLVGVYMVEIEAERGAPDAGLRIAQQVTQTALAAMPVPERRMRYHTQLAWLYEQRDEDPGVVLHLRRALQESPEGLRYSGIARTLMGRLLQRPRFTHYRDVMDLAAAMGMLP